VDDSEPVRQVLRRLFAALPRFKVVGEAEDGCQALEAITKLDPDLIILDIRMPRMNGLEVLHALKKQSSARRVIVFSQCGEKDYRDKCLELGAGAFLEKIAGFDDFQRMLKEIQTRRSKPPGRGRNVSNVNKH
jgi:DNA-binding NarL/FixJ family response regulator